MRSDHRVSAVRGRNVGVYCLSSVFCASAIALTSTASGETLRVPSQFSTIQGAINAASDGDVVSILAGTYFPAATIDTRGKAITIQGQVNSDVRPSVTIDGQNAMTVLQCTNGEGQDTRFENLVITNGFTMDKGGGMLITNGSSPTLFNCEFINNFADCDGGAIATVTLLDGALSSPSIGNCTFEGNSTNCSGGAVFNDRAFPVFAYCTFTNNTAAVGGGLFDFSSSSTLFDCTFTCNSASIDGGGMFLDPLSTTTVLSCTFQQNRTIGTGGGVFFNSMSQFVQDSLLCGNTPDQASGVFFNSGGNTLASVCLDCPDFNNDGMVNGGDLAIMVSSWGTCTSSTCAGDLNGDGVVDGIDLSILLSSWGGCLTCP